MPKPSLEKNSGDSIKRIVGEDKGIHTFPMGIYSKVNVIARLEFKLTNFEAAIQNFSYYATEISLSDR